MKSKDQLTPEEQQTLIRTLKARFEKNMARHPDMSWKKVEHKLLLKENKLNALHAMEETGGEPDVIAVDGATDEYTFFDCSKESPQGRRSLCYDRQALEARKKFKPRNSVMDLAAAMGIEPLEEGDYRKLQQYGDFDTKTSSWLSTPSSIRERGGAIFGDFRYGEVFIYHNGADSYYAARGFRGKLKV
ncbi:MAG: hypothetical protein CL868_07845 [Cytophagaceae bacterium]|nr:hypothetical protein [Cytophagaceae bacterium]|tara:strand:- start:38 stop:601 length:564 start_codon:yes stop_codon:yes gene_type:complete